MCGIVGWLTAHGPGAEDRALLRTMARRIAHRGPDAEGLFSDRHCALASRRLAIIDLPGGHQPMVHPASGAVLVFNGEIYNYRALRCELSAQGYVFRTHSDTEVLLAALEAWGAEALPRLVGMFAFALWAPDRRTLILGRDRLGKKPLVYTRIPGGIVFASEIKALLVHPHVPRSFDFAALRQTLDYGFPVPPRTFLEGITQVRPGHVLTAHLAGDELQVRETCYWRPPTELAPPAFRVEASAALSEILTQAVTQRLEADVPIACYLSGGIDSSSVATLAAQTSNHPVQTIAITFAEGASEAPFARLVSAHAGTQHHEFRCQLDAADLPRLIWHLEAPLVTLLHLPLYLLARTARELGFRVVLCGDGSDETWAGYDYFKYVRLLPFVERSPQRRLPLLCRLLPPESDRSAAQQLFHLLRTAPRPHPALPYRFQAFRFAPALLSDAALHAVAAAKEATALPSIPSHRRLTDQALAFELHMRLPGLTLPLGDTMSMAHGVELRSPFLDHRLVELAARLPASWKLQGLREKALLRRAMAPLLPPAICQRRKQPLAAPAPWFVRTFRPVFGDVLSSATTQRLGYFRPQFLTAALHRFDAGGEDIAGILVLAFFLHLFHEQFVANQSLLAQETTNLEQ